MTNIFDQYALNYMIVAVDREMTPPGAKKPEDMDTMFMGGPLPSEADEHALANFGLTKNWQVIFPSFELHDAGAGPISFHAVVTDGETQASTMRNGRLWKRDRRSRAILLFPEIGAVVKLSSKRRLILRQMTGQYHDHGYDLALQAVRARAARKPGGVPIVASVGSLLTVMDMKTLADGFAAAI